MSIVTRKKNALERLEYQLEKGVKKSPEGEIPLTKKDKHRIQSEIDILKNKIFSLTKH